MLRYCEEHGGLDDVADVCRAMTSKVSKPAAPSTITGYVYLMKSGRNFKVGRSNAVGRRHYEVALQLPEPVELVHQIATDDPEGIERYWHQRFADRRTNGEWFRLTSADVAAFKRRRTFM